MEMIKKVITLDFAHGKKTFIIGILMIIHGGSKALLDLLNGTTPTDMDVMEIITGFGFLSIRKAII